MTTPSNTMLEDNLRSALASGERPKKANALSASLTFGWRALLKIKHVPEQLFDAVFNPIIFTLLFTYLLGGAIAGSTGAYLQYLIPGILVQTVLLITAYTAVNLNTDISKGVADRFRSLPIWRPAVIVGALLGDAVRYVGVGDSPRAGVGAGLSSRRRHFRGSAVSAVAPGVRVQRLVDLDGLGARGADAEHRVVGEYADHVSPHVRQQHLRGPEDYALMASDGRRIQPHHSPRDRGSRPDVRHGDDGSDRLVALIVRHTHRRLRPAHDVSVPEQEVSETTSGAGSDHSTSSR